VADEGDFWAFHIDPPSEIHPTETVNHVSLPVLGNCICVAGHGELEGCIRDITGPFILVALDLIVYFFVRRSRSIQFVQGPGQNGVCTLVESGGGASTPYLTKMHLLARMRACSFDSKDRIMNGREVSMFGGSPIVNL